jgi:hypothetical protein
MFGRLQITTGNPHSPFGRASHPYDPFRMESYFCPIEIIPNGAILELGISGIRITPGSTAGQRKEI